MLLKDISEGDEIVANDEERDCLVQGQVYKVTKDHLLSRPFLYVQCKLGHHYLYENNTTNFSPFIQQKGGWIGVDLDGTLAVYDKWRGPYHIGEPIPAMVERVKRWLKEGRDIRIFTARVTQKEKNEDGTPHDIGEAIQAIQDWLKVHVGACLPVTNVKDWSMVELWDDRCIQVVPNTGRTLAEEHEAIRMADSGKVASA